MLSIILDSGTNICELAWRRIKIACAVWKGQSNSPIVLKIPETVVDCGIDYIDLINWKALR